MPRPNRGALAAALLLACGLSVPVHAADAPAGRQVSIATKAATHLAVQPGDDAAFAGAQALAFQAVPGERDFSGELLVRARADKARRAADRLAPLTTARSAFVEESVVRVPPGMTEGELAGALMATGDYEFVEPNWTLYPLATQPNDPQFGMSWQHTRLQSALAWDVTQGSSEIVVAVCDTGVRLDHADLADALVPGYNAVNRVAQADGGQVDDVNGHGTFVAGCAAAIGDNGVGVTGVGWNFRIMPVRVSNLSSGNAGSFNLREGARWAAANGAKVVNVSYSGGNSGSNNVAARDVKNLGGLLFWAAGNDGVNVGGNFPDLIIVGSTTSSDNRSGFSNHGPAIDVTAPGSGVRSTRRDGGYGNGSGTSYASPIAAGVGAMIFSANPDLSPDDAQDVLYRSVDDLGPAGWDPDFGHGRVNTFKAVTLAQTYVPRIPLPLHEAFDSVAWAERFETVSGAPALQADAEAQGGLALAMDAGDVVETLPLAGMAARLNHSVRLNVRSDAAPGTGLSVQYRTETGNWVTLFEAPGTGADTGFVLHEVRLPMDFAFHGSTLRLAADDEGEWLIDSLGIDTVTPFSMPFVESFDTGAVSPLRFGAIDGVSTTLLGSDFAMEMPNGASVETVAMNTIDLMNLSQWAWFFVGGDALVPGDTLTVEYHTPSVGWNTLTTIDGAGLTGALTGVEVPLPVNAVVQTAMRLRFTAQTAGGSFFVDDLYVGLDRMPETAGPCSPADVAEPFGTIDVFDLLAYLDLYGSADPAADLAAPFGTVDLFDMLELLDAYGAGCP